MKKHYYLLLIVFNFTFSQSTFDYQLEINPVTIPNFPGIHSYAFGQNNGKWLIIGGRVDGIHARQPFNAFPASNNNTNIYVVDINTQQFWTASTNSLSTSIKEQLQASNFNFYQDNSSLYIIGGYAFSATANDHITFDKLTSIDVPNLIDAIINGNPIQSYFKQIQNSNFAITGGQLGKIDDTFYLIGGHRFDGRYNPMNNPTFTQTYSNQIRKFNIDNSGNQLSISNYETITDAVHLHRRDYNLMPQIFPDGTQGYTISSGVFQINVDLPFLYPVDIKSTGYFPQTNFNQYLSNYHSAKVGLYDATENRMHNLFFGGISQYYYNGTILVQDNNVPFVNTISRTTRFADGSLIEYQLPVSMPSLKGASAEFILNKNLPYFENEVIKLDEITSDEFVIGHIVGGIQSSTANPFTSNQTGTTSANATIYEVKLIRQPNLSVYEINGKNPFSMKVVPNPSVNGKLKINFFMDYVTSIDYFVSTMDGKIIADGEISDTSIGENTMNFEIDEVSNQTVVVTFIFDNKFYVSQKVLVK
ncbi:MAG TPA: hypothetical protein PK218_02065 [Flavobacterium sp.]|jgi:hypothetical protein|uniref:hypothetical protein n=1 Tax=Flavobacterium sp. TaxID=239 RepID=UPI002C15D430|nr:hypothetical protein [Flavobacterium sp.]HPW97326.1 hypothetical protein [Flavobacterium sp.]HQA73143.1 hypothetical protein [Flavobacterium sp.]